MTRFKAVFNKSIFCTFFLCILFVVAMCVVLSNKVDYHVDEIFTYGKANYQSPRSFYEEKGTGAVYIPIRDGKIYIPGGKALMDYVTVQPEYRFNYANVWKNEAKAVHPPFHTALVHTVCSFFPEEFSHWFAGVVNIAFAVLTLLAFRALTRCYIQDERVVNIISFSFAFSGGILSNITFLRMYIMAMFWVTLLSYCIVKECKEQKGTVKFFVCLSVVTLCGALTHYYCILYAVLISVTYGAWLLFKKKYHYFSKFTFAMAVSGFLSYVIFPAMIKHIFSGPRGLEVRQNAVTLSDFFSRLKAFYGIINSEIFGNWAIILIWGFFILCFLLADQYCCNSLKGKRRISNLINGTNHYLPINYMLLIVPTVIYFIIVVKISVYRSERYIVPIYANIFLLASLMLVNLFDRFSVSKVYKTVLLCFTLAVITINSWFTVSWQFLYLDAKPYLDGIAKHAGVDNICLYSNDWQICVMIMDVKLYRSIQFCNFKNDTVKQEILKRIGDSNPKKLVVSLVGADSSKHQGYLQEILKQSSSLNYYRKLGTIHYGFVTSYLLF